MRQEWDEPTPRERASADAKLKHALAAFLKASQRLRQAAIAFEDHGTEDSGTVQDLMGLLHEVDSYEHLTGGTTHAD